MKSAAQIAQENQMKLELERLRQQQSIAQMQANSRRNLEQVRIINHK